MPNAFTASLHAFTTLAFVVHIAGGTIGLVAGTIALFTAKGGRVHRAAGTVFFVSMLAMAAFAAYLGLVMPGQLVNVFIATFATYLIVTAWLAVHRPEGQIGSAEKVALVVGVILCAPFLLLSFQTATGMAPFVKSTVALKGPVLAALYGFTTVLVIAAFSDAKTVLADGISGAPRIARHLWRMCLGLTMAAGSAFTNGLPRLLPGPVHATTIDLLPQFVPLVLMVFWLIRVRLTGWYRRTAIQTGVTVPQLTTLPTRS